MNPFWNRDQKRLRAGWRVLIQAVLFVVALASSTKMTQLLHGGAAGAIAGSLSYIALGVTLTWLMSRFVDRRRFADLGFHFNGGWWIDFIWGIVLGGILMSGIFLSMHFQGWVHITRMQVTDFAVPFAAAMAINALVQLSVGINEELTFRGYQLRNIAEGFSGKPFGPRGGIVMALLISSAVFGLGHLGNPNASWVSSTNIVLAGFMIALPFLLTGELATPIGLHLSWNFMQGNVFGFAVSGTTTGTQLLDVDVTGPELWTGGAFGPEAGLLGVVWMLIGCVLSLAWVALRRGNLRLHTAIAIFTPRN